MAPPKKKQSEEESFTDTDEEMPEDPFECAEKMHIQENINVDVQAFKTFLDKPETVRESKDPNTNIVDRARSKCYCIPNKSIPKFFEHIEKCRRNDIRFMMYEKQLEYSGIMLDFDIYQDKETSQMNYMQFHRLIQKVITLLVEYLSVPSKIQIHIGIIKKPKVVYNEEKKVYKDGFHLLIPGIKATRPFKKFFINELLANNVIEKIFYDVEPAKLETTANPYSRADFLDKNSAHVGVFFLGASTKINAPAYVLTHVFKADISMEYDDVVVSNITEEVKGNSKINLAYEFSLNWERDRSKYKLISKASYEPKERYVLGVKRYENTSDEIGIPINQFNQSDVHMSPGAIQEQEIALGISNPDAIYYKQLIDSLNPERARDYYTWFQVLCVLAGIGPSYKSLAEYFSRKCPEKFDLAGFEKIWLGLMRNPHQTTLTIGSLHYWAKTDSPERYREIQNQSIYTLIYKRVFDPTANGQLGHFDIAKILHKCLSYKYIFDRNNGLWYEFILETDPHKKGELYKWRCYINRDKPTSMKLYISEDMPKLFSKSIVSIKEKYDKAASAEAKYYYTIYVNLQKTCKFLMDHGFKRSVLSEAESLFDDAGFAETLDKDPTLLGVGNGVLRLGPYPELITGYHGYRVSKFTSVDYVPFNPNDDIQKNVIIALRNLFPDDEPDSFDFIMYFLSSALDARAKETMMVILVGKGSNGKSVLVELVKGVMGSLYAIKLPISFLISKSASAENASPALMMLEDARFCYYSESNQCETLNMAKIKEFTGQETLAGRKLYSEMRNFKPHCHHLVSSNNDFEIPGTDHGTWRRIKYLRMKIKFCPENEPYDRNNKYERRADSNIGSKWAEDPNYLTAFLAILVHYYSSLQRKYRGKVLNVQHPHLRADTEKFRNQQDLINRFFNFYLVKCADPEKGMPIDDVIEKYSKWYSCRNPDDRQFRKWIYSDIENSLINRFLVKNDRGLMFMKGWRVLDAAEAKADDEVYYCHINDAKEQEVIITMQSETAEMCHKRLCHEYDSYLIEQIETRKAAANMVHPNQSSKVLSMTDLDSIFNNPSKKIDDSNSGDEMDYMMQNPHMIETKTRSKTEAKEYKRDENGIPIIPAYDPSKFNSNAPIDAKIDELAMPSDTSDNSDLDEDFDSSFECETNLKLYISSFV